LGHHPGIKASRPHSVTLGGLRRFFVDVSVDPTWTRSCPFSQGRPAVPTLVGSGISAGVAWDVEATDRQRVFLFDLRSAGFGANIAINVDVCCGVQWDARIAAVAPVVASFTFGI